VPASVKAHDAEAAEPEAVDAERLADDGGAARPAAARVLLIDLEDIQGRYARTPREPE
jgi:hypothetical protein